MVTTETTTVDEVEPLAERVERAGRSLIAGHPQGAVRRIALYVVVALALGGQATAGIGMMLGLLGLAAVLLLAVSDQLA